jgi:hypothetical protein
MPPKISKRERSKLQKEKRAHFQEVKELEEDSDLFFLPVSLTLAVTQR